jgi:hypothetical protein
MRHFSLCFGVVFLVVSLSADAADANQADTDQKDYAVSFGVGAGSGLYFRKALSESTWIFAGASIWAGKSTGQYTSGATTVSVNTTTRSYSVSAGVRQYLSNNKLSKFIQLSLDESYSKYSGDGYYSSYRHYGATGGYGLEYFLDTHLSIEGTVGLSYSYTPDTSSMSDVSNRGMSFPVVGTAISYYW